MPPPNAAGKNFFHVRFKYNLIWLYSLRVLLLKLNLKIPNFCIIIRVNIIRRMPPTTVAKARGRDLTVQSSLIKKQLIIKQRFKIIGLKEKIQNLPETFVATPNRATIDIKGINTIVILVNVVI